MPAVPLVGQGREFDVRRLEMMQRPLSGKLESRIWTEHILLYNVDDWSIGNSDLDITYSPLQC